ncbi:MAG: hypothetical protein HFI92_05610 [Lachnospiraceae bacterium]|nr:hypothetical protein [Lachnospiraceae bacterium]
MDEKKYVFHLTLLDIYELIKPLCHNVYYMPLCISDKWKMNEIPEKYPIIVQLGRNNHILHKYALKFVQEYPEYEYIYADYDETTKQLTYFSTQEGQINTLKSRNDYMKMLNRAAVCILSSPGIDKSRKIADGIDYPTPRFYETAINYCHMIARYGTDHEEFQIQGISNICDSISEFSDFKNKLLSMLSGISVDKNKYDIFINMHLTSTWFKDFKQILNEYDTKFKA